MNHTNNASEQAIGRSKVRYKSTEAMKNGVALTQWLYSGEDAHDPGEGDGGVSWADRFSQSKLLKLAHRSWNSYGSPPL